MAYLEVEKNKRIYFEYYPGKKRPVVLAHGWGMSCRVWDTTLVALQENGNAVITFDQRGCGLSDKDFAEVSIGSSAGDIVALVDHLKADGAVVNGWSLGGAVAVEAAHRLGRRASGLVLTCAASPRYVQAPDFPHGGAPDSLGQTLAALRADRASFLSALTAAVCAVDVGDPVRNWMWSIFMQASPSADLALLELGKVDQRAILAGLDVPLLSCVGAKDVVVAPEIGRIAGKMAKQGAIVEFAESGHAPFIEEGPKYRKELLSFINGLK